MGPRGCNEEVNHPHDERAHSISSPICVSLGLIKEAPQSMGTEMLEWKIYSVRFFLQISGLVIYFSLFELLVKW